MVEQILPAWYNVHSWHAMSLTQASSTPPKHGQMQSQLQTINSFDLDGNQTTVQTSTGVWHVEYNAENRPVLWTNGIGTAISMSYDHQGRRIRKTVSENDIVTSYVSFIYDDYLQIAAFETAGETNSVTTTLWDPTEPVSTRPLYASFCVSDQQPTSNISNLTSVFYCHDLTKNITAIIDPNASIVESYDYDAFGTHAVTTPNSSLPTPNFENRFLFSSEYHDSELGLHYYNYRHYNPLDGRRISRDPMEETGFEIINTAYNKIKRNRKEIDINYSFVANSPIISHDLLGLKEMGPPHPCELARLAGLNYNPQRNIRSAAGLICYNGTKHICVWTTQTSRPGIIACIVEHEEVHLPNSKDCPPCGMIRLRQNHSGEAARKEDECRAYTKEVECLESGKIRHCKDLVGGAKKACEDEFEIWLNDAKRQKEQNCK